MTFPIPDEALDGRIGIVGLTGSGKSTTAKGGVERLLTLGRRTCVVDLLDGWWGLRLLRDGKTPAFPVAIFGGRHGDLPLNEHAGAVIGQAIAQSQESAIVSLSEIDTDAARRRFALAFFDALHRHNRAPLHLVIDEADFYAPQQVVKSDGPGALLLNRVKEIAARGRMRGFRLWPITQRPAKLNKDVLSQCDTLVAMQLTSSQDRNAIEGWIGDQADKKTGGEILATLPRLKQGQGVLWSPRLGILRPENFPLPATYDSSRTPEYGQQIADVDLGAIDLPALRERMAKVEAETKANDPAALKKEIARLNAELRKGGASDPAAVRAANDEGYRRGKEFGYDEGHAAGHDEGFRAGVTETVDKLFDFARALRPGSPPAPPVRETPRPAPVTAPRVEKAISAPRPQAMRGDTTVPQQRILDAIAWYEAVRMPQPTRSMVAFVAGYRPSSGGFNNLLGSLRTAHLIDYPTAGAIALTEQGRARANAPGDPPTTDALQRMILGKLSGPQGKVLSPLIELYPDGMSRADLGRQSGYQASSGGFNNLLGSLRGLGLIDYPAPGQVRATSILFLS